MKLSKCCLCGTEQTPLIKKSHDLRYYVECSNTECGAYTNPYFNRDTAKEEWNNELTAGSWAKDRHS